MWGDDAPLQPWGRPDRLPADTAVFLAVVVAVTSFAAGVALGATVLLFQRAYSTAKATAEENAAGAKYVGAVEERAAAADAGPKQVEVVQPLDQPVPVAETPRPAKKAAAKKAAARRNP